MAAEAVPSLNSSACEEVEVGISFGESAAGFGWAITRTDTEEDGSENVTSIASFFPTDTQNIGSTVQTLCLDEGRYEILVYNGYGTNGIESYYIKYLNGDSIVQGGKIVDFFVTNNFDI